MRLVQNPHRSFTTGSKHNLVSAATFESALAGSDSESLVRVLNQLFQISFTHRVLLGAAGERREARHHAAECSLFGGCTQSHALKLRLRASTP